MSETDADWRDGILRSRRFDDIYFSRDGGLPRRRRCSWPAAACRSAGRRASSSRSRNWGSAPG
ncbi:hypothetical protein [Hankyongella ginsenosidimutans]|uniref:hypothetical protein n=1 Tax=Hankyongella ginsenosidimutans TaxID=1763828 RepID=UPI001CA3176C|nr:hypothetical protein [Hankyongella ginsenosidimutans]